MMKVVHMGVGKPAFDFLADLTKRLNECQELGKATCSTSCAGRCCFIPTLFEPLDQVGLHRERYRVCSWLLRNLETAIGMAKRDPELGDAMEFRIFNPSSRDHEHLVIWEFNCIDTRKQYDMSQCNFRMNVSQTKLNGGRCLRLSIPFAEAKATAHLRGGDEDPMTHEFTSHT